MHTIWFNILYIVGATIPNDSDAACRMYLRIPLTTHLLSIERHDWPKLHDMLKARDAKTGQRKFPAGFRVRFCALDLLFINFFRDVVVGIESRCVIKSKHVLLVCSYVRFCVGKTALALKRSCNFSQRKIDRINRPSIFYYIIHYKLTL